MKCLKKMFRLSIILACLSSGQTMSPITQHLLTPLREQGEACGYESCPQTIEGYLNIHVIPHTHAELGYTRTFDQHFTGRDDFYEKSNINMKRILDYVISELWSNRDRKFTFSDLAYLYKWWTIRDGTVHRMVYELLRQGRLQIVGGGWSMTDEATAHYQAIIDSFTYTLRKLNATFLECGRPLVTWQSDVFGHTSEFASLMAQMGFDGHFINPISYDDELDRMRSKRLEFIWQGSPDLGSTSEIFSHKLFDGYWSPPGFCFGGQCGDPLLVSGNTAFSNIEQRVKVFVEAMQYRQSPHYATSHLVVMMGQRFGYYDAPLWFQNIEKLIRHVNEYSRNKNLKMNLYYSTPACYLKAVHASNASFPFESGDFVPVAYDKFTHFSGIFTSRPTLKYAAREGNLYLQISKQLQVLARLRKNERFFENFHWIMGVFQDHDILSGGLRSYVRDYYVQKMHNAIKLSDRVVTNGLETLMHASRMDYTRCLFNISYCEYTERDKYHIVVYNPLAWNVTIPVRLPTNEGKYTVFLPNLKQVPSVKMMIPQCVQDIPYARSKTYKFELVFLAENVPAIGYRSYFIEKLNRMKRAVHTNNYLTKIRESNDEFSNSHDHFSDENNEMSYKDVLFGNSKKNNDEFDNVRDYTVISSSLMRDKTDYNKYFNSNRAIKDNLDEIQGHPSKVIAKNVIKNDLISRKKRSVTYKNNFTMKRNKNEKFYGEDLRNNRNLSFKFVELHNINIRSLNEKNVTSEVKPVSNITKEPNITKIIRLNNTEPNNDLKIIFESIDDVADNMELDFVFDRVSKIKDSNKSNDTNQNTETFNLNTSSSEFNTKYGDNEKHDDNVAKSALDNIKDHRTRNPIDRTTKKDLNYSNIGVNENKNNNILKGLRRCNCRNGRLKREHVEKSSEEADTIDHQTFGNKTLRFLHFKQDEITQEHGTGKSLKRETEHSEHNKIKYQERKLKSSKQDEINNLKRQLNDLKHEIEDLTRRSWNETRPERSLFKKINKNAKKKYLRRQTSNLKIDDESLLNNDHHYDDNDYSDEDEDFDNTTDTNERYVFEHVTDHSDYVVTPKSKDEAKIRLKLNKLATRTTTTTKKPTTQTPTTTTAATTKTTATTTRTATTKKQEPIFRGLYSDTTDSFISNKYINITVDIHKNVSYIALANGLAMVLNINFYYYASDDPVKMGRPEYKKPGAYVFRPMEPEPVLIRPKMKVEVHKSDLVEEIHSSTDWTSFIIRLYKDTPFFEVQWIVREIPITDGIGKEVFIRYNTDLENRGVFYTDSNGRQTMRREYGHRPYYTPAVPDAVAGNFYPVTSKITIEDLRRMIRFSVFNDRTQAGSSFNGEIDLMLNRRILTDDAGIQAFMNETENGIGTTITGKHYIYVTKITTKLNKIYEKKLAKEIGLRPQIFQPKRAVDKSEWTSYRNEYLGVNKIPIGLNILTLQEWNDASYLLRIENYLEKSDVLKSGIKRIVLKELFNVFRITEVRETTLAGNILLEHFTPLSWKKNNGNTGSSKPFRQVKVDEDIEFRPQQIRTFIIWVQFH